MRPSYGQESINTLTRALQLLKIATSVWWAQRACWSSYHACIHTSRNSIARWWGHTDLVQASGFGDAYWQYLLYIESQYLEVLALLGYEVLGNKIWIGWPYFCQVLLSKAVLLTVLIFCSDSASFFHQFSKTVCVSEQEWSLCLSKKKYNS